MWLVTSSMLADVVDSDELRSGDRSEGDFNAIFAWIGKASTSLAYGWLVYCHLFSHAASTPGSSYNLQTGSDGAGRGFFKCLGRIFRACPPADTDVIARLNCAT